MTLDLPEGWVIDPLARARLEHQLTLAPPATAGVLAPLTPLPPGASYRSLAEHLALLPLEARHRLPAGDDPPAGALLRAPVGGDRSDDTSDPGGPWLVDDGTAAHDPSAVGRDLLVAHPLGCSPFPRRPVVVLLGLDASDEVLEWARVTANAVVAEEVEARLAVTRFPEGSHLTRPCLADPRSLATLRPHVVLTLDPAADEVAEAWCHPWRATTLVDLDAEAGAPIVVHPFDVGVHAGRRRASIRTDVAPDALASLVRRLAAGPQPGSPVREQASAVRIPGPAPRWAPARLRPAAQRSVTMATGSLDTPAAVRIDALATTFRRFGDMVELAGPATPPEALEAAGLLILRGLVTNPTLLAVTARRRERGRPTIVDLGSDDLGPAGADAGSFGLAADVADLVSACGLVSSPSEAWCAELRASGLTACRLPTPHRPLEGDRTGPASGRAVRTETPRIGWVLDPHTPDRSPEAPSVTRAAAQALTAVLEAGAACLVIGGDPRGWPEEVVTLPGVTARPGKPDPDELAGLSLVVWTPDARSAEAIGVPRWVLEAGLRHLPILVPRDGAGDAGDHLPPESQIHRADEPEAWSVAVDLLLSDEPAGRAIARDAHRRAYAATAPGRGEQVAADLITWAFAHAPRPATHSGVRS